MTVKVKVFTLNYADEIDKKIFFSQNLGMYFYVYAHISDITTGISVTIVKSFKRAFKCRQAELTGFRRLDFTSKRLHAS